MSTQLQVTSGGASLAVETLGNGDPVVFLHAAVADRRMWRSEMNGVANENMAIAYDRRGFGESVTEVENYSSVSDLMAVLDATSNGAPAILVGCSQGGRIAIDAALTYPERVRALVLIAPNVTGEPSPTHSDEIKAILDAQRAAEATGELEQISRIKARLLLDGALAEENRVSGPGRELFHKMYAAKFHAKAAGRDTDSVQNYNQIGEIAAPTLILWGDLDFPHVQARCQHIASVIPRASTCELRNVAHLPSLEKPEVVTRQIVEFARMQINRNESS